MSKLVAALFTTGRQDQICKWVFKNIVICKKAVSKGCCKESILCIPGIPVVPIMPFIPGCPGSPFLPSGPGGPGGPWGKPSET